jgi:small-conductance mechanosensitive channel
MKIYRQIALLFAFIVSVNLSFSQDTANTIKTDPNPKGYVVFKNDTLFLLKTGLGPFTVEDRVNSIRNRLEDIAGEFEFSADSIFMFEHGNLSLIRYKKKIIMSISDEDAALEGSTRKYLAENYKEIIQSTLKDKIENLTFKDWLINIGLTLLTLIGLIVIFYAINRFFKWVNHKLNEYQKKLKRKRKSLYRYLVPSGPDNIFVFISNIVRWILYILLFLFYLPLLFSFLPWTRGIVQEFYKLVSDPVMYIINGFIDFLPDLFFIIIIYFVAKYVVRVLTVIAVEYEKDNISIKGFHKDWAKPTLNLMKIIIYAFALIFMFPHIPGSESKAFQGVSIFFGVLLSLGSTSAISNVIAGVVITYMRPFQMGDRVKVGETIGDVIEKSLLVTKIRTLKNEEVTVPNATIINTHLWNFSKNAKELGLIIHTSVTIGYDVPWDKVNKLLLRAARNTTLIQKDPKPFVLQKSLDDYYVNYEINAYTKQPKKMALIYSELHKNILDAFNGAGIEILSPQYNAVRDGNPSTIPGAQPVDNRNPVEKVIDKVTGKEEASKPGSKPKTK